VSPCGDRGSRRSLRRSRIPDFVLVREMRLPLVDDGSTLVRTGKGVIEMTQHQAEEHASRLGLSIWEVEAVMVGRERSETVRLKCFGFAGLELALGEAESWEEALQQVMRIVFSA
jgi:hypothetical protein